MGRVISILAVIGSALAGLLALVISEGDSFPISAVIALLAVAGGIFLTISRDWQRWAPGAMAILLAVLGALGIIGYVGGEDGGVEFPISPTMGTALVIISCLQFPLVTVLYAWGKLDPEWLSIVQAAIIGFAGLMALAFNANLDNHAAPTTITVGLFAFAALWPSIVALRQESA